LDKNAAGEIIMVTQMPIRVGILTISDRGAAGERADESGQVVQQMLSQLSPQVVCYQIVPDEKKDIQRELLRFSDELRLDLIFTTGGTGLSPRDVTPEVTAELLHKPVPGIAEAMRGAGLKKTPYAMLSRAVCGIRGQSLILNLPGSPRAVSECLEVIIPALPHAVKKLRGDMTECASL
jgi:molybdenum cofactor synthesis domain-containing protein